MPDGACVLYDARWFANGAPELGFATGAELRAALETAFGPPFARIDATDVFPPWDAAAETRAVEVFRAPGAPVPTTGARAPG